MSQNKKRPRVTSVSAEPKIDEDLLCLICRDLVVSAKQVACCGSLFCEECINTWMSQGAIRGRRSCPSCRVALNASNIFADLRSERKSAEQPRRCPNHESFACYFIGTRQEVANHKLDCLWDPDRCISQRCKANTVWWEADRTKWEAEKVKWEAKESKWQTEKAKWEAKEAKWEAKEAKWEAEKTLWEAEEAKWQTEKVKHSQQIQELQRVVQAKSGFVEAALSSPEEIIRTAYGLDGAKICTIDGTNAYTIKVRISTQPALDVDIVCTEGFVALYCYRPAATAVTPASGFPSIVKVVTTLISFDAAVIQSREKEVFLRSGQPPEGFGFLDSMTPSLFEKYVKYGKFALGWKVSVVP